MKKKVLSIFVIIIYFYIMLNLIYSSIISKDITSNYMINTGKTYSDSIIIEISKISLKMPVLKALDDFSNLDNSIVYYKKFDPKNKIIIFGHSGIGYGAFFNRLDELNINDSVFLYNKDMMYEYEVFNVYNVDKTAVYLLNEEENSKKLLLITCIKNDKNKRLVVELKLKSIKTIEK